MCLQGGYAGNALGFKVASLTKLMDTRANKPRVTLLHHLVAEAEKEAEVVLNFAEELLPVLTEASRYVVQSTTLESVVLTMSIPQKQQYFIGKTVAMTNWKRHFYPSDRTAPSGKNT